MKYKGWKGLKEARYWQEYAEALHRVALAKKEAGEIGFDCDHMCKNILIPRMEKDGLIYREDYIIEKGKIKGVNHFRLKVLVKMCFGISKVLVDPATGNRDMGFINNKDLF